MEISAREAARRLHADLGISRDHARRVLTAGLAGTPTRHKNRLGYDEDAVRALTHREIVRHADLERMHPFIARIGRSRQLLGGSTWAQQAEVVAERWYVPVITRVWLGVQTPLPDNRIPLVATIADLVAFGAEITGFHRLDEQGPALRSRRERLLTWHLDPPGDWFDLFREGWLPTPPGPAWVAWGAPTAGTFETVYAGANRPA